MSVDACDQIQFVDLPGGWHVGQVPLLSNLPGVRHAVSTRIGPHGGDLRGDSPRGLANRHRLAKAIGASRCVWVRQVHGNVVADADDARDREIEADAITTCREGIAILGQSADCPIVLVADPERGAVGVAHASWRGTVQRVAACLVAAMRQRYRCDPAGMLGAICPSAGPCCYEVQQDVIDAATAGLGPAARECFVRRGGRTYFDLWRANARQLAGVGISPHNIAIAGVCTICDERFYSYRREGSAAGRFGGIIARI